MGLLMHLFGGRIAQKVTGKQIEGSPLDVKFGFRMMKDRRVPMRGKLLAIGVGSALIAALVALELPVESIVGALAAGFGFIPAMLLDGMEVIIGPVLFACLLLPFFAPHEITQRARMEHAGLADGPVIDIEGHDVGGPRGAGLVR